jgi:hypothetical protein
MRGMGCALSIDQKDCRKSLGCALYIGARYLSENRYFLSLKSSPELILKAFYVTTFFHCTCASRKQWMVSVAFSISLMRNVYCLLSSYQALSSIFTSKPNGYFVYPQV